MNRRLARFGVATLSLCAALGLAEVSVRIFDPHARDLVVPGRLFAIDGEIGWKLRPNRTTTHHTRYFDTVYATNAQGFRDRPRAMAPAPATHRIVLYGDSLIFGWGVPQEQRFSDVIERERPLLEVWNHAVTGYGLDQELIAYEHEGRALPVDEVMFFVGGSTATRVHDRYLYAKYKPIFRQESDGRLTLVPVPAIRNAAISFVYDVMSPFYLPYSLQTSLAKFQAVAGQTENVEHRADVEARRVIGAIEKALLVRARDDARERHHQMTILVGNLSEADRRELRGLSRDQGIACLEISPQLETMTTDAESDLMFGPLDRHWNAKANALIAEQLLAQMPHERP